MEETTSPPESGTAPSPRSRDDSLWGVALAAAALALAIAAVFAIWRMVAPLGAAGSAAAVGIERYSPFPNGAAFTTQLTNPDGTITYRSRTVERGRASIFAPYIDLNSFAALIKATNLNLESSEPAELLDALSQLEMARLHDIEYDARGEQTGASEIMLLIYPDRFDVFAVNGMGITPPIPVLSSSNVPLTVSGELSSGAVYTSTLKVLGRERLETAVGSFNDCLRVEQLLSLNAKLSRSQTWYCAGVGEVRDETVDSPGGAPRRADIIAASVGSLVRGVSPIFPTNRQHAASQSVFPHPIAGTPVKRLDYDEPAERLGISTAILPLGETLLYGTQSGSLVGFDLTTQQPRWRFQTGEAIYGAPVVANGIAYFGAADKKAYAVRVSDGAFVWAYRMNDLISASPAVLDGTVFFASEDRTLYALDADTGKLRWSYGAGGPFVARPVISDGVVFASSDDGTLHALDAATGALQWSFDAEEAIVSPIALEKDRVLLTTLERYVFALDPKDGTVLWSEDTGGGGLSAPVAAGGRVFARLDDEVWALEAETGARVWRFESPRRLYGAPLVLGNQVWIARSGDLIALDASNGAQMAQVSTALSSVTGALSSDGRELYLGHFDGILEVFGAGEQ